MSLKEFSLGKKNQRKGMEMEIKVWKGKEKKRKVKEITKKREKYIKVTKCVEIVKKREGKEKR